MVPGWDHENGAMVPGWDHENGAMVPGWDHENGAMVPCSAAGGTMTARRVASR